MSSSLLKSILKRDSKYKMNNFENIYTYDIFLSYHWKNQVEVIKLHRELEKYFRVWLDLVEIRVGDDLNEKIENAIQNSKIFLCCMNNDYLNTGNCKYELLKAQNENKTVYVLPFEKIMNFNVNLLSDKSSSKIENVYEMNNSSNEINVDNDISSILEFIFGSSKNYPAYQNNCRRIYNSIPSVQAYRA